MVIIYRYSVINGIFAGVRRRGNVRAPFAVAEFIFECSVAYAAGAYESLRVAVINEFRFRGRRGYACGRFRDDDFERAVCRSRMVGVGFDFIIYGILARIFRGRQICAPFFVVEAVSEFASDYFARNRKRKVCPRINEIFRRRRFGRIGRIYFRNSNVDIQRIACKVVVVFVADYSVIDFIGRSVYSRGDSFAPFPVAEFIFDGSVVGNPSRNERLRLALITQIGVLRSSGKRRIRFCDSYRNFGFGGIAMRFVADYFVIYFIIAGIGRRGNSRTPFAVAEFIVERSAVCRACRNEFLRAARINERLCRGSRRNRGRRFLYFELRGFNRSVVVRRTFYGRFYPILAYSGRYGRRILAVFARRVRELGRTEFRRGGRFVSLLVVSPVGNGQNRDFVSRFRYGEFKRNFGLVVRVGSGPFVLLRIRKRKNYVVFSDVRSSGVYGYFVSLVFGYRRRLITARVSL